jgi:hypothetical protein
VELARYAKHNGNFVLVVSGSLKAKSTKKVVEIVYDLLIKAIELSSLVLLEFGVLPVGLGGGKDSSKMHTEGRIDLEWAIRNATSALGRPCRHQKG